MIDVNDEVVRRMCDPNFDFQLGENIYTRFRFPFPAVKAGSRIVIYGGGVVGKTFLKQVNKSSYCTVRAICDRAPRATGIVEVPVIDVAELAGLSDDEYDLIVIANERRSIAMEIREDLIMAGLSADRIIYVNPSVSFCAKHIKAGSFQVPELVQHIAPVRNNVESQIVKPRISLGFEADPRFAFPFDKVKKNTRVIVYGGGVVGKTFLVQALAREHIRLIAVCDRHPEQIGIRTLPVLNLAQLSHLKDDTYDIVLIANERKQVADEIIEDLMALGIPRAKICWFNPVR